MENPKIEVSGQMPIATQTLVIPLEDRNADFVEVLLDFNLRFTETDSPLLFTIVRCTPVIVDRQVL